MSSFKDRDLVWATVPGQGQSQVYPGVVVGVLGGNEYEVVEASSKWGGPDFSDQDYPDELPGSRLRLRRCRGVTNSRDPNARPWSGGHEESEDAPSRPAGKHGEKRIRFTVSPGSATEKIIQATGVGEIILQNRRYYIGGTTKWFGTEAKAKAWLSKQKKNPRRRVRRTRRGRW